MSRRAVDSRRVVALALTLGAAVIRYFGQILSGIIAGIGFLMAAFDDEKRALHDRLAETRVIRIG